MASKWYKSEFSRVDRKSVSESLGHRRSCLRICQSILVLCVILVLGFPIVAQSPNGTISGLVLDASGKVIVDAEVIIVNDATRIEYSSKTNGEGIYVVPNLQPGQYRLQVSKIGFKTLIKPDIVLNVQGALAINFTLPIGAASDTVTVTGGAPLVDTEGGAVSTVVDRQFAENLPMNGRSFQTLIELTPGVVVTPSNAFDNGQFSINGQRSSSNYWMVDGVSANISVSAISTTGNGFAGAASSSSVLGGTNSLVSVDALQEFRIQTSTYAPEFGRTPGGQISIVTRSGANQLHGTLFDYLRNDVLDANNWFNSAVTPALPKAEERQNDFGGTFSGPIVKDRTFFFFSYEGLRLRLPQTTLTTVPDLSARQNAVPAMQPFLNAFPFDPKQQDLGNGIAQFDASYSNSATLDAYSLRVDHKVTDRFTVFGRYNYSPSSLLDRGVGSSLSEVLPTRTTIQTATIGTTWAISPTISNDLRFNYSRTSSGQRAFLDDFGGAVPLAELPFPSPFTTENASLALHIVPLVDGNLSVGEFVANLQRQLNLVDSLSVQKGSHSLKFGVDFRRLSPVSGPESYSQFAEFQDVSSFEGGSTVFTEVSSQVHANLLFRNLGVFAQDTWRIAPRLTVTYGLRWDVDFAPSALNGQNLTAVRGFNLDDLSDLALAPVGTPPFTTKYGNVAPRLGVAYQVSQNQEWQTVLRGGFGVFYDLATQEVGNNVSGGYPFSAVNLAFGSGTFPLSSAAASPPLIAPPNAASGILFGFDPHLQLPRTLEWNIALEQALGKQQILSISYVGAGGRRLIQSAEVISPNPNYLAAELIANTARSDYNALQVQFQRRLSHGMQALSSYTWSHSIDDASAGSFGSLSNFGIPGSDANVNRGPSDFDIRHAFSAGLTYDIPKGNALLKAVSRGWSTENFILARSAPPVDISDELFGELGNVVAEVRPDLVSGQAPYLHGSQYPGGKAFNPAAFTDPPFDPTTFIPLRQGDVPRNFLRGFGAAQWDFAVHREFPLHEALKLQFRAEMFNVLNHPNFGSPSGTFLSPAFGGPAGFGLSTQMLAQSLAPNGLGGGAFNPLYQIGGPRSVQFALKLQF